MNTLKSRIHTFYTALEMFDLTFPGVATEGGFGLDFADMFTIYCETRGLKQSRRAVRYVQSLFLTPEWEVWNAEFDTFSGMGGFELVAYPTHPEIVRVFREADTSPEMQRLQHTEEYLHALLKAVTPILLRRGWWQLGRQSHL